MGQKGRIMDFGGWRIDEASIKYIDIVKDVFGHMGQRSQLQHRHLLNLGRRTGITTINMDQQKAHQEKMIRKVTRNGFHWHATDNVSGKRDRVIHDLYFSALFFGSALTVDFYRLLYSIRLYVSAISFNSLAIWLSVSG